MNVVRASGVESKIEIEKDLSVYNSVTRQKDSVKIPHLDAVVTFQ